MAKRSGILLFYPLEEKRLEKYEKPVIVQPKLDGERCRVLPEDDFILVSSSELPFVSVPHINQAFQIIKNAGYADIIPELDGELYCHGMHFDQIHSIVSREYESTRHPDYEKIELHLFDVITNSIQAERLSHLNKIYELLFISCPCIKLVPSYIAYTYEEVIAYYNQFISEGYEGIIVREASAKYVRRRATTGMKFKPKKVDSYKIIAVVEAIDKHGNHKGMVGAFWCTDDSGNKFKVGAGELKHVDRYYWWKHREKATEMWCTVQYQNLTSKEKVPRHGLCKLITVTMEDFSD